jgi:hypothetical protein
MTALPAIRRLTAVEAAVSRLTGFLARLIGLFMIIVGFSVGLRKQESVASIDALAHRPDLVLVIGLIMLVAGLAIVLRHNVWSGGALPVVITLLGWIILLRAGLLLFLSEETVATMLAAIHFEGLFYAYVSGVIAIGLCLAYAGFASKPPPVESVKR